MEKIISVKNIYLLSLATLFSSIIAWHWPIISSIITVLTFFLTLYLTSKNVKFGLLLAIAEILLGSFGKLFIISSTLPINISFRLSIFVAIILGTVVYLFKNLEARKILIINISKLKTILTLIALFILGPLIVGLLNHQLFDVFQDVNAWFFYALILPGLTVSYNKDDVNVLIKTLIGTSLATITLTIIVYILYGWSLALLPYFNWLYHWLRQVSWGEITHVSGNLYRIFSQAHISILVLWAISLTQIVNFNYQILNKKLSYFIFFLTSLTLIINLSRSMWVAAAVVIIYLLIFYTKSFLKNILPLTLTFVLAIIVSGLLIGRIGFLNLSNRASQQPSEPAIASRVAQLKPLLKAIEGHWLSGMGFGGKVGYPSEDPRAKQKLDSQGLYWTSAFEWGYLDQLLKFGALIFLTYISFLGLLLFKLLKSKDPLIKSFFFALLVIFVTHIFSPYLNHPLGIVWLIISIILLYNLNNNYEQSKSYN